ncbi:MAG TPA: DUF3097 domain-containing protein [Candidatus Avipropionibacterium avicola]|uniref:DUF3097 domain-containing protein n=1 Tax=Candidatus Avipropionibacterium avicola TaxID=2840701 RepID=A0A9D1KM60_9ACTN|nr:DUF3097 domain-containing protein [Candidatus Avipropionibacterium avicola]
MTFDRYVGDVLAPGRSVRPTRASLETVAENGLVVEDVSSGFCGAVVRCENGLVVLEDRHGKKRSFPLGTGFWVDGSPVDLVAPTRRKAGREAMGLPPTRTASGSRWTAPEPAKVALPSRIYVEGRHDAELVEKVWGDDLRHVGVVVEYLGGIDDLPGIVDEFAPVAGRRLGVLVDHLVPGSKESRIADQVRGGTHGEFVMIGGHPFIDIWAAVKPASVGIDGWPNVPRGEDWKSGTCARLGWPHADQADIARVWQHILGRVRSWNDLERALLTEVERLIDFVTQDHPGEG